MISEAVEKHCRELERCNQRGGRMLSIVDLIEAGTMDVDLAAYALAAISNGASFMTGAMPGGAGKTTVMCALLNFVPKDIELRPADTMVAIEEGMAQPNPRRCYICHEIGDGAYYAYLWDAELRRYFKLPSAGHMIATNLHADTLAQARRQVCDDNQVPEDNFRRMNVVFFISVGRAYRNVSRRVVSVWESDGKSEHRQLFGQAGSGLKIELSRLVNADQFAAARTDILHLLNSKVRTIEEVRAFIVSKMV
jgi:type IV secretory pathway ATPase VirB11/archaellum biosynthesis ATPase